ncbi:MAG: hypothetical protein RLZZ596_1259 [Pseudomonadota bacterium]|jgi:hypothetical protein
MANFVEKSSENQQVTSGSLVVGDAHHQIKKMWRIFCADINSVFELRALWPKALPNPKPPEIRHYRANKFASLEACKTALENDALILNAKGYNIYTVMNPIRSDFACQGCVKDSDIQYRDLLLIDIDRIGDTSAPANQSELDAAKALAHQIQDYMSSRGWSDPVIMMSGNGYHLYYVLFDLDNNDESATLVRTTLSNLACTFNNSIVGVDTTVYNASRITKVPGTIMRKGIASSSRQYRMAEVCDEE